MFSGVMLAIALWLLVGQASVRGQFVANTTTYITLRNKNGYRTEHHWYGVGSYSPDAEHLTVQQCMRSCSEDPRCDCAVQQRGEAADSRPKCRRHDDCNPGGFVSPNNWGYDVYMQVVAPWHLYGLNVTAYNTLRPVAEAGDAQKAPRVGDAILAAGPNSTAMAVTKDTVTSFTVRSTSSMTMSLTASVVPDSTDTHMVSIFANERVSIPGHGVRKYSWEEGVRMSIEPGQPWRVVVHLGSEHLPFAGAVLEEALHAKVILADARHSAGLSVPEPAQAGTGPTIELLELVPRRLPSGSSAHNVTVVQFETLRDKNAYAGFGGFPLHVPEERSCLTRKACQDACVEEPLCECATYKRESKRCWLRKDCEPEQFTSDYNQGYDVFMKMHTEWLQAGTSFANNSFSKAATAGAGPAIATSRRPLQSLTANVGWRGQVGLSASAAADSFPADGYFVNVSDGTISIPVQGGSRVELPYQHGAEVRIFVESGEVLAELSGSENPVQYPLGPSRGAMYGKFVLWEAGAYITVRHLLLRASPPSPPVPTPEPSQASGSLLIVLFGSMGGLLGVSMVATLAVVRWRRHHVNSPGSLRPPPTVPPDAAPMPVLLGCRRRGDSSGIAAMDERFSDPAWAAISLGQLNQLRDWAKVALGNDFQAATMHDVSSKVLQPLCSKCGLCYAHHVNGSKLLKADVFVSHAWQENFEEFVSSVNGAFSAWPVKPNLWICATALLRGPAAAKAAARVQVGLGDDPSNAPFLQALSGVSQFLIVRNSAVDVFDRIWCCWELYCAHRRGLVQEPGALMVAGPERSGGPPAVDLAQASATDPEDKRRILLHVLQEGLLPEVNKFLTEFAVRRQESSMTLP